MLRKGGEIAKSVLPPTSRLRFNKVTPAVTICRKARCTQRSLWPIRRARFENTKRVSNLPRVLRLNPLVHLHVEFTGSHRTVAVAMQAAWYRTTRTKNEVGAVYLSKLATVDCFLKKCLHRRLYCTLSCGTHTHCPSIKGLATGWPAEVDHSELAAETLTSSIVPCPLVLAVFLVPSSTDP